jgi:hypothetical protein
MGVIEKVGSNEKWRAPGRYNAASTAVKGARRADQMLRAGRSKWVFEKCPGAGGLKDGRDDVI